MRWTGWTPSIVSKADDQTVYLAVDDFGRNGRSHRETDVETADLETVILDLLEGQYNNPSGSSPSIPPRAGRRTFRKISPKSCAAPATCNCRTFRRTFRTSSSATRAGTVNSR
jgi:hypothetical protein